MRARMTTMVPLCGNGAQQWCGTRFCDGAVVLADGDGKGNLGLPSLLCHLLFFLFYSAKMGWVGFYFETVRSGLPESRW